MYEDIERHLGRLIHNLTGSDLKKNSGYEGSICDTLNMQISRCRYWDAEWKHHYIEFKKGRSIWLDLVRYSEILLKMNKDASQKHKPLIIREKPPNVKMFRGKDSRDNTGLTPALITPMLTAAIRAAGKLAILTPEKIISTTKRLRVVARIAKSEPIIILVLLFYIRYARYSFGQYLELSFYYLA